MQLFNKFSIAFLLLATFIPACKSKLNDQTSIRGLQDEVEILRDSFGINHIYAKNQHDLFFMQGYAAAKDRLFQFEIWRRQATGTLSEVFGTRTLKKDVGARLFKYRGNLSTELNYYHPQGEDIINAYVDGVNTYIDEILQTPEQLPIEFKILNIKPGKWTAEVVISRHQGLLGNVTYELDFGRAVAIAGVDEVKKVMWFHPKEPDITLDPSFTEEILSQDILGLYNAFHSSLEFVPDDIDPDYVNISVSQSFSSEDRIPEGSNNWVISGEKSASGFPMLANDPHRRIAVPSLRYAVHLVAPGWNVIGGGEPEIPGVSIGHNEYGAWGLTVYETDGEDLYVYDLNPNNLTQYKYNDQWVEMKQLEETIKIKDSKDVTAALYYTQHGPVTFIDTANLKAFAVRCAWLEPGGAPYLASLRMDQSKTWDEFRDACSYSHIPGENMIWADKDGNIGWQAVGIAPIRRNFSGLVPVPGDGRYEWDGYLPIPDKPHTENPSTNYIQTANQNVTPIDYDHWNAIGFEWSDPFRGKRVAEVIEGKEKLHLTDMKNLQVDYVSIPARTLVPYLRLLSFERSVQRQAAQQLLSWDFRLSPGSIEAGIYVAWENKIRKEALSRFVDPAIHDYIYLQMTRVLEWLEKPGEKFGPDPTLGRDEFLKQCFVSAIDELGQKFGEDSASWRYGQSNYKHIYIEHPLTKFVSDTLKNMFDVGPAPRGGNNYTVGATGSALNQSSGASFRIIMDLSNWDAAIGTNTPGQSGDPASPYYSNLFDSWSKDQYFPYYYSKDKVQSVVAERLVFKPAK